MRSKRPCFEKSLCFDLFRFFGGKFENTYIGCVINEVIDRTCKQRSQRSRSYLRVAAIYVVGFYSLPKKMGRTGHGIYDGL